MIAIGTAIVLIAARESTDPGAGRRLDLPGLAMLTVGLTALVLAMIQAQDWGAGPTVALVAGGFAVLGLFVRDPRAARSRPGRRGRA